MTSGTYYEWAQGVALELHRRIKAPTTGNVTVGAIVSWKDDERLISVIPCVAGLAMLMLDDQHIQAAMIENPESRRDALAANSNRRLAAYNEAAARVGETLKELGFQYPRYDRARYYITADHAAAILGVDRYRPAAT